MPYLTVTELDDLMEEGKVYHAPAESLFGRVFVALRQLRAEVKDLRLNWNAGVDLDDFDHMRAEIRTLNE